MLCGVKIMEITKELLDEATKMQEDKFDFIEAMSKKGEHKNMSYQTLSDIYWYLKFTEARQEVEKLRNELLPLG